MERSPGKHTPQTVPNTWGGRRPGAGRKPNGPRPCVTQYGGPRAIGIASSTAASAATRRSAARSRRADLAAPRGVAPSRPHHRRRATVARTGDPPGTPARRRARNGRPCATEHGVARGRGAAAPFVALDVGERRDRGPLKRASRVAAVARVRTSPRPGRTLRDARFDQAREAGVMARVPGHGPNTPRPGGPAHGRGPDSPAPRILPFSGPVIHR